METQTKAIEPVPGGMWQKRAAELLGAGVGAVNHWVRTYREGCFASMFVRQVRQCFSVVWADGFPRCRHRFPVM